MAYYYDRKPNQYNRNGQSKKQGEAPKFGSPYNFVPINEDVLIPWWQGIASQDAPMIDAESGRISLTLTNLTPMFIRDGGKKTFSKDHVDYDYSAHISTPEGRRYFIPGSSLRGMIRSVAEILSFSRFEMYDDSYFGYRDFPKNVDDVNNYKKELKSVLCGWLRMDDEKLYLTPCGEPSAYNLKQKREYAKLFEGTNIKSAKEKHKIIEKAKGERYPRIDRGRLVCTGLNGKIKDYLFGEPIGSEIELSDTLKKKFLSVYQPSPYYDNMYSALRRGEQIPVFYVEDCGTIKHLGLTRYYRISYRYPISKCFSQLGVKDNADFITDSDGNEVDAQGHDMTQTLFGYIDSEGKEALKGRVWIDSAFADRSVNDNKLIPMMGVLGAPHASFYPRYLTQDTNTNTTYVTYKGYNGNPPTIAGRKRYRVHSDNYITALPQGNGNQKVMTKFMLIPAGMKFSLSISFHNLMPEEIGLLLSAITLHGTKGVHHNIGMAKGYGYGKLDIKIDSLSGLQHDAEYYLRFFELYINNFTRLSQVVNSPWASSSEITTLMSIMSDHSEGLEIMGLKEHRPASESCNKDKVKLVEKPIKVNTYIHKQPDDIDLTGLKLHEAIKKLVSEQ